MGTGWLRLNGCGWLAAGCGLDAQCRQADSFARQSRAATASCINLISACQPPQPLPAPRTCRRVGSGRAPVAGSLGRAAAGRGRAAPAAAPAHQSDRAAPGTAWADPCRQTGQGPAAVPGRRAPAGRPLGPSLDQTARRGPAAAAPAGQSRAVRGRNRGQSGQAAAPGGQREAPGRPGEAPEAAPAHGWEEVCQCPSQLPGRPCGRPPSPAPARPAAAAPSRRAGTGRRRRHREESAAAPLRPLRHKRQAGEAGDRLRRQAGGGQAGGLLHQLHVELERKNFSVRHQQ